MTELQRYLAEEVAEDHHDGIITRREAMRRLGLLGVGGAVASTMLAGYPQIAAGRGRHRKRGHHPTGKESVEWAPVATEEITFEGPRSPLMGAWAPAAHPRGSILVIHENRGLTNHIRSVAGAAGGRRLLRVRPRPALRGRRDRFVPG